MHLIAGGPIAVADRHDTIGDSLWVYQNEEMLALNKDGFVGQPLTNDPTNERSQVWTGRMSNGDAIVALFNRESTPRTRSLSFADIGITGDVTVRDLWQHAALGPMSSISLELAPHASMVVRVSPGQSTCTKQAIGFDAIGDVQYGDGGPTLSATATSGLPVRFEVALGPAELVGNQAQPTGMSGIVYVVASQPGNDTWCAALPVVGSFAVLGGHQPAMYIGASFTNWVPNISMKLESDTWVAEKVHIPAGDHEFKFANAGLEQGGLGQCAGLDRYRRARNRRRPQCPHLGAGIRRLPRELQRPHARVLAAAAGAGDLATQGLGDARARSATGVAVRRRHGRRARGPSGLPLTPEKQQWRECSCPRTPA
jgi:hypothetical protein